MPVMNVSHIYGTHGDFKILQTTARVQTGVMRLSPGESSAETPQIHPESDQLILVLTGDLHAEVDDEECTIPSGSSLIIPAGTPHRLVNRGHAEAFTFTSYSPPAYPE